MHPQSTAAFFAAMVASAAAVAQPSQFQGPQFRPSGPLEGRSVGHHECMQIRTACPPDVELNPETREYCQRMRVICR